MNTANVHAGRLERRVRRVGKETLPGIHGFCSLFPFGAIRGVPLLRVTALDISSLPVHTVRFSPLPAPSPLLAIEGIKNSRNLRKVRSLITK